MKKSIESLLNHFQNGSRIHNNAITKCKDRPKRGVLKLAVLLFFFLSSFLTAFELAAQNKNVEIFSSETLLIDVRTPFEFHYDHLEKAVNIPLNTIKEDIKYFAPDKEKAIAVYCTSGRRSEIAYKQLKDLGYKNVVNAGEFKELKKREKDQNNANPDR